MTVICLTGLYWKALALLKSDPFGGFNGFSEDFASRCLANSTIGRGGSGDALGLTEASLVKAFESLEEVVNFEIRIFIKAVYLL